MEKLYNEPYSSPAILFPFISLPLSFSTSSPYHALHWFSGTWVFPPKPWITPSHLGWRKPTHGEWMSKKRKIRCKCLTASRHWFMNWSLCHYKSWFSLLWIYGYKLIWKILLTCDFFLDVVHPVESSHFPYYYSWKTSWWTISLNTRKL